MNEASQSEETPEIQEELTDDTVVEETSSENLGEEEATEEIEEAQKWKDIALRERAELENFRKRMAREKADSIRFANQRLIEELLPVLDNFDMGMMAASQDQDSMIFKGMEMVRKQFGDFLNQQGVKEVEAEGLLFDPNVHEALSQEVSETVPAGHVIRVMRRGFMMNDRLVRPSSVVVSQDLEEETSKEEDSQSA